MFCDREEVKKIISKVFNLIQNFCQFFTFDLQIVRNCFSSKLLRITTMQITDSFKVFLLLAGGLIIGNLIVMNDFNTVLNVVESDFLLKVQSLIYSNSNINESATILIPFWQSAGWYQFMGFSEFNVRLLGIVILLLSFVGFYFFGKKIFGIKPTLVALLVAGSCFFPVNLIKFASGDTWLLGSHLMSLIFLLLYLKQPINKWKWSYWAFVIFGTLVHPLSSLVWNLGLWGYLQIVHPNGKRLSKLYLLPLLGVLYLPLWFFGHINLDLPYFFMGIGSGKESWYFPILLFGILPWIGFLPAALWDMFQKLKKKEEMAIINLGWILFGIFSQSMVLFIGLAFIMGKQALAYFQKNYPYIRLVKAAALLNMIFTFCALIVIMMQGYLKLQTIGYRSLINVSAIYWMMGFIAVLGLFLRNNPMVTGGMAMSGILSALVFWLMVNPLLENQRNLPQQVFRNMSIDVDGSLIQLSENASFYTYKKDSIELDKNFQVYLNENRINHRIIGESNQKPSPSDFVLISTKELNALPDNLFFSKKNKGKVISGGFEYFTEQKEYQLIYLKE